MRDAGYPAFTYGHKKTTIWMVEKACKLLKEMLLLVTPP